MVMHKAVFWDMLTYNQQKVKKKSSDWFSAMWSKQKVNIVL